MKKIYERPKTEMIVLSTYDDILALNSSVEVTGYGFEVDFDGAGWK